jgi:putative hydrolase of the HAD superfamily
MKKINLDGIDNIIFDLGMVVIDLDMEATTNAFKDLFGSRYDESMSALNERFHFEDYETGQISTAQFLKGIQEQLGKANSEDQIATAWNAMLKTIPERRFRILKAAQADFRTFCLSNTNELHIDFIYAYLKREKQIADLDDYFEKVYLSHEIKMRKPNIEIFEYVLDQNQLDPQRTLFIDDTAGHLKGADQLGIRTYHLAAPEQLEDILGHLAS